jgi:putative DNA primase/helicase
MPGAKTYARSDAGNAEYFAALFKGKVKYDHARRRWLLWKPPLWQADYTDEILNYARAAMRRRRKQAMNITDTIERKTEIKWTYDSESVSRLAGMLKLAKAERAIQTKGDEWDADRNLLGCANGVVDLRLGQLLKPDPAQLVTMSTGVEFDPNAKCKRWEEFLIEVMPDQEVREYISKVIGYCLTGDTREQILTCLYGLGGNGKSIFLDTLLGIMGDYGHTMAFATIEFKERGQISNDVAALVRKRLVVASETQEGVRLNEGRIKSLTGCERITCRFLYQESFSYYPSAKYFLAFNHKPIVIDDTEGFWRRLKLLTFKTVFTSGSHAAKRDKQLDQKLRAELPGILAWAVRQCVAWFQEGLSEPAAIIEDTRQYREESNPILEFIEDEYVRDPDGSVPKGELYKAYISYCRANGERFILGKKNFGQRLSSMGFTEKRDMNQRFWCGLKSNSDIDVDDDDNPIKPKVTIN